MTGKSLSHSLGSHIIAQTAASTGPKTLPDTKLPYPKKSENRVDDLLRAFSDVAYSPEEEDLPWESWNYTRISAF
ncbi:MAG: hypothetical protein KC800_04585 [Candidatus Eremiobacteraeota bacterium]|nr:hypothetical protein [Candidatus Eremiobacteraeota bacterium]